MLMVLDRGEVCQSMRDKVTMHLGLLIMSLVLSDPVSYKAGWTL